MEPIVATVCIAKSSAYCWFWYGFISMLFCKLWILFVVIKVLMDFKNILYKNSYFRYPQIISAYHKNIEQPITICEAITLGYETETNDGITNQYVVVNIFYFKLILNIFF